MDEDAVMVVVVEEGEEWRKNEVEEDNDAVDQQRDEVEEACRVLLGRQAALGEASSSPRGRRRSRGLSLL